ncbi:MAG: hypothetical protein JNJ57_01635 [Saprospiraceae bacterium]|nr:hypothetical protein [Saprospiraceae bacterium]
MKNRILLTLLSSLALGCLQAQDQNQSKISGALQSNGNFFIYDEKIVAPNIPHYDYQKFGAESWLNLNYSNWGFDMGLRFDLYNNSNLLNPAGSYTDQGIGRWFVHKQIGKLDLEGGYIYDQIGTGIIYRAYEERALMIDNALFGVKAGYALTDNWHIKGFTGRQKQQFGLYGSIVRGAALEGFIKPDSTRNLTFAPGIGVVGRTYDAKTVEQIVNTIATYAPQDSTGAQYNTYAASVYNTMTAGNFTWFVEGAVKSYDVINDPNALTTKGLRGKIENRKGYTVYTSIGYAQKGLGATLEFKRTHNFSFRHSPFATGVQGPMNFLPPMAKQNTFRLTTRFAPATQEIDEQAVQLDLSYKLNKKVTFGLNFSDIQFPDGTELYREITPEVTFKQKRKWQLITGLQILKYNIFVYQNKGEYVNALTPYAEYLYRFSSKRSVRIEAQYLHTEEEFGSWVNALVEIGLAPHWLFTVADMYKLKHQETGLSPEKTKYDGLHFPTIGAVYTHKSNRIGLSFVKQVEGINCAGGICRFEPAFSGVKLQVSSVF